MRALRKSGTRPAIKGECMALIEKSVVVQVPVCTAYNQRTQFEEFPKSWKG